MAVMMPLAIFLGFLLDDVNADIGINQVSHLQTLCGIDEWLIFSSHEIIREIVYTVDERSPRVIFGNENNNVWAKSDRVEVEHLKTNFFYKHLSDACTAKFVGVDFDHQSRNELYNHQYGYDTRYQNLLT